LEVGSLLIKVSFDHGDGGGWMATDLSCGEVRPGSEVAASEGSGPGGQRWREQGGVVEGDAAGNGGVSGKKGVDLVLRLVLGKKKWWGRRGGKLSEIDGP
jgi:hypothetical protein